MEQEDPISNDLYRHTRALSVALGYRDHLIELHSERVRGLSAQIGAACGLSENEMGILAIAASFHDIGKIGIPDKILLMVSQYDKAEWEKMKQHPEIGEKIMAATNLEGSQQASLVIRHHHEHYNGRGYPDRLSGEAIPICSRIIGIADSYDAMSRTRAYHHARTHQETMSILREETGEKHDPELMSVFCKVIESSEFNASRR